MRKCTHTGELMHQGRFACETVQSDKDASAHSRRKQSCPNTPSRAHDWVTVPQLVAQSSCDRRTQACGSTSCFEEPVPANKRNRVQKVLEAPNVGDAKCGKERTAPPVNRLALLDGKLRNAVCGPSLHAGRRNCRRYRAGLGGFAVSVCDFEHRCKERTCAHEDSRC